MQSVWDCAPPVTRAAVEAQLTPKHPMAVTTLLTLLSRLTDKGFLSVEKRGRSSLYTPLISRRDYRSSQSRRFVRQMFGGNMTAFAAALCDGGVSKEELEELRRLLEENKL